MYIKFGSEKSDGWDPLGELDIDEKGILKLDVAIGWNIDESQFESWQRQEDPFLTASYRRFFSRE